MELKHLPYKYKNVLLIDDNDLDNFINEKIITSNKFAQKIYVASSAKSAIEFLGNIEIMGVIVAKCQPDVIFIDINMPMMDGFQFIEFFRNRFVNRVTETKLVLLTSSINKQDKLKADTLPGNIVFLNKPLTHEMLSKV